MGIRTLLTFSFAAMLGLQLAGCGRAQEDTLAPGEGDDSAGAKADGVSSLRLGVYALSPELGDFFQLTLREDGGYALRGGCMPPAAGAAACNFIIVGTGTYRLTKSGSKRFVRLTHTMSGPSFKLSYTVAGDDSETVTFTDTATNKVSVGTLAEAKKKQEGESCGGFISGLDQCATGLICKAAAACCDIPGHCALQE
jgi:hypothetical protein